MYERLLQLGRFFRRTPCLLHRPFSLRLRLLSSFQVPMYCNAVATIAVNIRTLAY